MFPLELIQEDWSAKNAHPMLTSRKIIFEVFPSRSSLCDHDGRTDGQTDRRLAVAIPRSA